MSVMRYRKARGITVSNLAKMAGISEIAVYKYEQNPEMFYAARYDTILKLAEILRCEPIDLVEVNRPYGDVDIICAISKGKRYVNHPCYFGDSVRDVMYAVEKDRKLIMDGVSEDEEPFLASDGHTYRMFIPARPK